MACLVVALVQAERQAGRLWTLPVAPASRWWACKQPCHRSQQQ